jgi:serine/threonine protein kinase
VELLAERYEIARELGRGTAGTTYLARDTRTGADVIVKLLSLGQVTDWKSVELFEREAEVLRALRHERIPACLDYFRADLEGDPRFVLVRQYVAGSDLQEKIAGGWRATEAQIREIGRQLIGIVAYIHALRPPVIHRDINPRNIVMRDDGAVFLIDFGGVQDAIRLSSRASTMVGTPGYAPMEQFVGHATVRSDLYGLAATLLFLLTRRSPADLPTKNLKPDLEPVAELASPGLARVLSSWLEPDEAARTLALEQAEALLSGDAAGPAAVSAPAVPERPPSGSRIVHTVQGDDHRWVLPLGGRGSRRLGTFGIAWLGFVGFWTYSAVHMKAPIGFVFFAFPFLAVGVGVLRRALASVIGKLDLRIGPDSLSWSRRLLFSSRQRTVPVGEAGDCRMEGALYVDAGAHTLRFGESLSNREREWLRDSINRALLKVRGRASSADARPADARPADARP